LLVLLLYTTGALAVDSSPPSFPAPPNAEVTWVGQDMVVNGIPTQIRSFYTKGSLDRVGEYYRNLWIQSEIPDKPGYVETEAMAPWKLITHVARGWLMTVQYQKADKGGSWGYLAASQMPDKKPDAPKLNDMPALQGTTVLNSVESRDVGQKGRSMVLRNTQDLAANLNFYRDYYRSQGFAVSVDKAEATGKLHVLDFRSGSQEVHIVLLRLPDGTQAVVQRVEKSIL
jgi:hypothetical protein